ncbi:MAG: MFS transporter [Bryobacteraceae bacterium]
MSLSLWRHLEFQKLWAGQTISEIGSRITREGIPITAFVALHATPMQMGVLVSLHGVSALFAGAMAGRAADRRRRRPIMIMADVGRALVLLSVPVAAAYGELQMWQLYAVVFVSGVLTIFFDVAYQSYLPSLVPQQQLLEGNSKLALSAAAAEVLGPAMTGFLIQVLTAPRAILLDSLSFLVSAISIGSIRTKEAVPVVHEESLGDPGFLVALRYILSDGVLRALFLRALTFALFIGFFSTLYVPYAFGELHLNAASFGIIVAMGGVGNLIGASVSERLSRRIPVGMILIGCSLLSGLMTLLIPLAHGPAWMAALYLGTAQLFGDVAHPVYHVHELTLRQRLAPPQMLGRVNACLHLAFKGFWPMGALLGGVLGSTIGTRPTLVICALGAMLSTAWLIASPVATLRHFPESHVHAKSAVA